MALYYGCDFPEDRFYHRDHDCWIRFDDDQVVTMGMTDIAQTMAGKFLYVQFKKAGRKIKAGRSAATIESAKWVGPFVIPFAAEILATNHEAFEKDILIANREPYEDGWLVKIRLEDPEEIRRTLMSAQEALTYFRKKIEENDIRCFRCID